MTKKLEEEFNLPPLKEVLEDQDDDSAVAIVTEREEIFKKEINLPIDIVKPEDRFSERI